MPWRSAPGSWPTVTCGHILEWIPWISSSLQRSRGSARSCGPAIASTSRCSTACAIPTLRDLQHPTQRRRQGRVTELAVENAGHATVASDEERHGQVRHQVGVSDGARWVEQRGEAHPVRTQERARVAAVVEVDGDDVEPLAVALRPGALQQWQPGAAVAAPRGEEVDQHRVAAPGREVEAGAAESRPAVLPIYHACPRL